MPDEAATPDLAELTRRSFETGNRRDFDLVASFYAPDAVFDMTQVGMGRFEGLPAIREFIEDWWSAYDEFEAQAEEVLDLGHGVTFAVIMQEGRPVGSGGEVALRYAAVNLFAAGLIVRTTNYTDIDEARAAAERLAEEPGYALSQDHGEASILGLTRRAFASANSGDYDVMMTFLGPNSVWDFSPWGLGTYTGRAAIRRFFEDWIGALDTWRVDVEEVRELGDGVVMVIANQTGRPVGGGAPLGLRHASVLIWSDGVVVQATNYRDVHEAQVEGERLARARE